MDQSHQLTIRQNARIHKSVAFKPPFRMIFQKKKKKSKEWRSIHRRINFQEDIQILMLCSGFYFCHICMISVSKGAARQAGRAKKKKKKKYC